MRTEAMLASAVSEHLRSEGWDIFFEVGLAHHFLRGHGHIVGAARADIVAVRGEQIAVCECKLRDFLELFAQGKRWIPYTHLVWIAVPKAKRSDGRDEAYRLAREYYGLGLLEVGEDDIVKERVAPRTHPRSTDALFLSLDPQHKTSAAPGTNRGGQWTSFKRTAATLAEYVAKNPGCKLEEAIEALGPKAHHYASKRSAIDSLSMAIKRDQIPNVYSGWRRGLYPTEQAARGGYPPPAVSTESLDETS
jgi:hypothetical protein